MLEFKVVSGCGLVVNALVFGVRRPGFKSHQGKMCDFGFFPAKVTCPPSILRDQHTKEMYVSISKGQWLNEVVQR